MRLGPKRSWLAIASSASARAVSLPSPSNIAISASGREIASAIVTSRFCVCAPLTLSVAPLDLGCQDPLRLRVDAAEPDAGDLACLVARAAYALAEARIAGRGCDAARVAAQHLDLGRIRERSDHVRIGRQHLISHRHQIDRVPYRPPAPAPVAPAPTGCAACLEGAQDVETTIHPERRRAVDAVAQDADGDVAFAQHGGARYVALKSAAMAEPVEAFGLAAGDAEAVMHLHTLRNAPLLPRHLPAACKGDHAFPRLRRELSEEARGVGGGGDEARRGGHGMSRVVSGDYEAV